MGAIFSTKPDHPLGDEKESLRIIAELAAREPLAALGEASAWIESLVVADDLDPRLRLELILRLDEAALPHARRLARDYLNARRLGPEHEFRLWHANRNFWVQMSQAYQRCLDRYRQGTKGSDGIKSSLPLLYGRLLHAFAAILKWDQFRYGPIDDTLWADAGKAYLCAEADRVAGTRLILYAGGAASTPASEYLQMLVFSASSMGSMLPFEIEIAERLIAHFRHYFEFSAEPLPGIAYWVDPAKSLAPVRLAQLPAEITPTLRFFGAGRALEAIAELRLRILSEGEVPPDINLNGQHSARIVLPVLEHLATYWAPMPPMRHHPRHVVKSRMTVINGLPIIHQRLCGRGEDAEAGESWILEDVSRGGMAASAQSGANDWIRIGTLVGMQPDGGDNWLVGVIRRYLRESSSLCAVGIETLSKAPRAIFGDSNGLHYEAILLDADPHVGDEVDVMLPGGAWEEDIPLSFELDGRQVSLQPLSLVENNVDVVLGRYRVTALD